MVNIQEKQQLHSQIKEQDKELELLLQMEHSLLEQGDLSREKLKGLNVSLIVSEKERDDTQERVDELSQLVFHLENELKGSSVTLESEEKESEVSYIIS